MKTIALSERALEKLDLIAKAPALDTELLNAIGFTPADALRFARETKDIPSVEVVQQLIQAWGSEASDEFLTLLAMANDNTLAEAGVEPTTKSGKGVAIAIGVAVVGAGLAAAGLGIRTWRRIRARNADQQTEIDSENIGA